jgi:hypothetical protein
MNYKNKYLKYKNKYLKLKKIGCLNNEEKLKLQKDSVSLFNDIPIQKIFGMSI